MTPEQREKLERKKAELRHRRHGGFAQGGVVSETERSIDAEREAWERARLMRPGTLQGASTMQDAARALLDSGPLTQVNHRMFNALLHGKPWSAIYGEPPPEYVSEPPPPVDVRWDQWAVGDELTIRCVATPTTSNGKPAAIDRKVSLLFVREHRDSRFLDHVRAEMLAECMAYLSPTAVFTRKLLGEE